jgi:hypothetical protein
MVYFASSATTNQWQLLLRSLFVFDTTALIGPLTISAATVSLFGSGKQDPSAAAPDIDVVASAPASNTAIANADFSQVGGTVRTTAPITYANWSTVAYNVFTLNASGIGLIALGGITKLGARNRNCDIDAVAPAWASTTATFLQGYFADQGGVTNDPKLDITYTLVPIAGTLATGAVGTVVTSGGKPNVSGVVGTGAVGSVGKTGGQPTSLLTGVNATGAVGTVVGQAAGFALIVGGTNVWSRVRRHSLTLHDDLNDAPNTCRFAVGGAPAPLVGQPVRLVSFAPYRLLMTGTVQTVDLTYEGLPAQIVYRCEAQDDTPLANRLLPFGKTPVPVSATTIAQDLVSLFAPGFTAAHVEAGLPAVSVNFDGSESMNGCLRQLAKLIGGYFYWDDRDLHLFTEDTADLPDAVDAAHPPLDDPPITVSRDDSQLRTRVYGKGHSESATSDVAALETIIPIADAVMFNPAGGRAFADAQRLTYTGIQTGGAGALVGPGVTPGTAPTATLASGTGIETGIHQYAATWVTASGETLPSPVASVTHFGTLPTPTTAPVLTQGTSAVDDAYYPTTWRTGDTVEFCYAWAYDPYDVTLASARSPIASIVAQVSAFKFPPWVNFDPKNIHVTWDTTGAGDPHVRYSILFYRVNGGAWRYLNYGVPGLPLNYNATDFLSPEVYSAAGSPPATSPVFQRTALSAIPVGPSGTTSRKLYRTTAGGAQLLLLATLADNTTTTYTDSTPDASLGANAPGADTSALTQPTGQVNPGAASLITSGGAFSAGGGWAVIGSQVVRYTGLSGNTLTGIPASGAGAITAPISYNATVTAAPALIGVSGLVYALTKGTPVHVWVVRDDLAAQSARAQTTGTDGVVEHVISDERRGEASLAALCDADLVQFSRPLVTVRYATRDTRTKSGKPVVFNLVSPAIAETLLIQSVDIDQFELDPARAPRCVVVASTARFSVEDILRRLAGTLGGL